MTTLTNIKTGTSLLDKFDDSWLKGFGRVTLENKLALVAADVSNSREHNEIHPPAGSNLMFNAFHTTPLEEVKVVILGQDPYHDGSFNGLAFGNGDPDEDEPTKFSPSLRKVMQEVENNFSGKVDPTLYTWARQGVLLINTAHTVVAGEAGSHLDIWDPFTHMVLLAVNTKPNVVWMLWGAKAHAFEAQVLNDTHHIIKSGHPSPLNRSNPFDGQCFVECNDTLKEMGLKPIKWTGK